MPFDPRICCARVLRVLFFFQAEDGIRDRTVTGVQTCALPISIDCSLVESVLSLQFARDYVVDVAYCFQDTFAAVTFRIAVAQLNRFVLARGCAEIGRASCRERVWSADRAGAWDRTERHRPAPE